MPRARVALCRWTALALLTALATRAPFALIDRPFADEAGYALFARYWLEGLVPYRDVWDVKPPGLFALYAVAQALGAEPLAAIWILPLLAVCALALAFCAIGREWFGDVRVGALASVLFCLYSLVGDGLKGPAILLAAPFVAWGLLFARRAQTGAAALGGALLGCGVCVLQSSAFEAAFAFLLVAFAPQTPLGDRARRAGALSLGGLAAAAAFALLFHWQGALRDLWEGAVMVALLRSTDHGVGFWDGLIHNFRGGAKPYLPVYAAAMLMVAERAWLVDARQRAGARVLLGWFAVAFAGVLVQRAAHSAYMLAVLAPICLGASLYALHLFKRLRAGPPRAVALAAGALALAYPFWWTFEQVKWDERASIARAAAQVVTERLARPGEGDGLYAVDYEPALHLLTGQRPVSRFVFAMHLHCDFLLPDGVKAGEEIRAAFARTPRFVALHDRQDSISCIRPAVRTLIQDVLDAHYDLVGVLPPPRPFSRVLIYELREGMASRLRSR